MVMYMEANEGKLRRDEGIPDEKVMAFDPRDLLPSDIALEMEGAEVTAREAVVAHAVDSGPVPASIHVSPDPKLDTNPDVNACTCSEIDDASEAFKYRAELPNEHWADSHCEPGVKAELKPVQPAMYIT